MTVKYTFERTKEDITKLEKVRKFLKNNYGQIGSHFWQETWHTDSQIYRNLPDLFLNAVKEKQDLQLAIDELTAKLAELEDLRTMIRRIFEICKNNGGEREDEAVD
jgi:ribosome-associated translation inhibitor RaiA